MAASGGFFARRLRGEVPMRELFWRDLVLVGTLINLLATGVALAVAASGGSMALAAGLHFLPLPYNLFLVASVWRLPGATAYRWAALGWLALVTLV